MKHYRGSSQLTLFKDTFLDIFTFPEINESFYHGKTLDNFRTQMFELSPSSTLVLINQFHLLETSKTLEAHLPWQR